MINKGHNLQQDSTISKSLSKKLYAFHTTTTSNKTDITKQQKENNIENERVINLFPIYDSLQEQSDVNLNPLLLRNQKGFNNIDNLVEPLKSHIVNCTDITLSGMSAQDGGMSTNYAQTKQATSRLQTKQSSTRPELHQINSSERYIWDMRRRTPNTTPASTVLNSPDLTEMESRNHYQQQQHSIKLGRSPVSHGDSQNSSSPVSPSRSLTLVTDGEMVVFDDIGDNWHANESLGCWGSGEHNMSGPIGNGGGSMMESPTISESGASQNYFRTIDSQAFSNADLRTADGGVYYDGSKVTKMIGGLPIAEYEGSPRRFGNIHYDTPVQNRQPTSKNMLTSPSYFPPRPGFPQRIVPSPSDSYGAACGPLSTDDLTSDDSVRNQILDTTDLTQSVGSKTATFDYLYEFSETRKVLEEFFKCPNNEEKKNDAKYNEFNESDLGNFDISHEYHNQLENALDHSYIGQRLAKNPNDEFSLLNSPRRSGIINPQTEEFDQNDVELFLDSGSRSSGELADTELEHNIRRHSRNFTLSPETTDYDSNCGDLDSLSNDMNGGLPDFARLYTSMPVLEDGLSSGHASDTENNNPALLIDQRMIVQTNNFIDNHMVESSPQKTKTVNLPKPEVFVKDEKSEQNRIDNSKDNQISNGVKINKTVEIDMDPLYSINIAQTTPPPPAPAPHRQSSLVSDNIPDVQAALKDIQNTLQRTKTLPATHERTKVTDNLMSPESDSPVWVPRHNVSHESLNSDHLSKTISGDEEEADTDLETDRLLGQQRLDDQGYYDDKNWGDRKCKNIKSPSTSKASPQMKHSFSSSTIRQGVGSTLTPVSPESGSSGDNQLISSSNNLEKSPSESIKSKKEHDRKGKNRNKEGLLDPAVLIEGVLFRARYLGSTQLVCEGQPTKSTRMMQAEEAVSRIKAPEGESQPSTEVDLFISTEKIMVLNTDLKEIMMDHALRTISYIADIGDLVVLMARRRFVPQDVDDGPKPNRTPKMICHVFESDEAQFIAQSIGQAFQVAYMEFLKANGIEDHSFVKEMDYQEVLNSQEIFGDELEIFAKKELQKEVVVPKAKGEILGVVIVESGWGSMLPTVVIANLLSSGAAARCGQLNIGDQIIAINGLSLVGLPLSTCQTYIRNTKNQTAVKFTVVPCPPVVEVKIKRPNTKYQLGFSVQNGVICSLLRGGIAERGGVRVGHRIIEINNQSVVAVPHEKIVNLLATSVGEILMKTMPTSMFRLLTGQENPVYI